MRAREPMLGYLGLPQDDRAVVALLRQFLITRMPSVERDSFDEPDDSEITNPQDWLANLARGIEFGFEDEASFNGEPPDLWGLGPMLLTQIYLYSNHPEAASYLGALPFGIDHGDDRETIRAKLDPLAKERRSRELDTWAFDGFMVTCGYLDGGILSFVVLLCQPPAGEGPDQAANYPSLRQFGALLGVPVDDPKTRQGLHSLGYPHRLQWIDKSSSIMDLREDLGAYLEFERVDDEMVLALVQLTGDRRYGSAVWPGDLPGGLRFGCGWSEVLACAGSPPDSESEDDFTLFADWPGERFVTRIEYSTMTNGVLAVEIYLPAD